MAGTVLIRPVGDDERAAWDPLWAGYLEFYKTSLPQDVTDLAWMRFHDPAEPMFALGGYVDGKLTGIAHYLFHRSTWAPHRYCYLEDLFVADTARGRGLGRALIEAVYDKARGGRREPRLLADAIGQRAGARALRQGRRQSRIHPVPQGALTSFRARRGIDRNRMTQEQNGE